MNNKASVRESPNLDQLVSPARYVWELEASNPFSWNKWRDILAYIRTFYKEPFVWRNRR